MLILPRLYTLNLLYYIPHSTILAPEFIWQFDDTPPLYPRLHRFLNHWHTKIHATIAEINIYDTKNNFRIIEDFLDE